MAHYLVEKGYVPLDKSWTIRMGVLDLFNGYDDTVHFLEQEALLSDDLKALYGAVLSWDGNGPIDVGESGTLYRFLKFASWKLGAGKKFIRRGSLRKRKICNDPAIVGYSQEKLLELDSRTSQWASAAVLTGDKKRLGNPPYKLRLTYEAVSHWKGQRRGGRSWVPRYDETILAQAVTYLDLLNGRSVKFVPHQAEDYCFARAFGFVTKEEGKSRWPSLCGHESNRIREMERMLHDVGRGVGINSRDHRVVQAIAMRQKVERKDAKIKYPRCVSKSWPQFWKFLEDSPVL